MKKDIRFRSYYHGVFDAVSLLNKRIFHFPSDVVVASENKWKTKLEIVLDEERSALHRCEAEMVVRRSRVAWLEQVQADDLGDRYLWRKGLEALRSWKIKTASHHAKRKAVRSEAQSKSKMRKIDDCPPERVTLDQPSVSFVNCPYYEDIDRKVVCVSDSDQIEADREGFGSAPATPQLDSAMGVGSLIIPSKKTEDESEDVYRQLKKLVDEPVGSGSKGEPSKPKPKVGMRSGMKKGSKSQIRFSRVYSYCFAIQGSLLINNRKPNQSVFTL